MNMCIFLWELAGSFHNVQYRGVIFANIRENRFMVYKGKIGLWYVALKKRDR